MTLRNEITKLKKDLVEVKETLEKMSENSYLDITTEERMYRIAQLMFKRGVRIKEIPAENEEEFISAYLSLDDNTRTAINRSVLAELKVAK